MNPKNNLNLQHRLLPFTFYVHILILSQSVLKSMGDQNITLKTSSSSHWGHLDCTLSTLATLWKQHASPAAVAAAVLNHFVFSWSAAVQSEKFRQQSRPNTLYIVPEKIAEKQVWNGSFEMRPKQFLCRCSLQCFHIYHFSGIWNQIWSSS